MYRSHSCGELRMEHKGTQVTLAGWVQRVREFGGMVFIDLRDRDGITQLAFNMEKNAELCSLAQGMGREYVVQIEGQVIERENKNPDLPTGDIEIDVAQLNILNESKTPPFTIEIETDGGEEQRMQYRYLDIRREPVKELLMLRSQLAHETRSYLVSQGFLEVETPYLIKSTPEGARDFVVPSRMSAGSFYALPQSPQTFKQLLMVGGLERYFQIVKCFRDEDFRADRQPEFTQIDCEMAFVEQADVLNLFEGLMKHLFKSVKNVDLPDFPHMLYSEAIAKYGSDKPDTRFEMLIQDVSTEAQGKGFNVFDSAEAVIGICVKAGATFSRKQLDAYTDFVKQPQIGAKGLVYIKWNEDGTFKSSVDKFFSQEQQAEIAKLAGAEQGDVVFILSGKAGVTHEQLGSLRLEVAKQQGMLDDKVYAPLWVVDFPLLEWDETNERYFAMHHPFTSPKPEQVAMLDNEPGKVNANAYDMVINGVEIGGGSIRIHDRDLQQKMFKVLGFTEEEANEQFGFLMSAFEYGAPPHGGIAFGFDRICAMFGGVSSIREVIAFPKNNQGKDLMIDAPSLIDEEQLKELHLKVESSEPHPQQH